MPESSPAGEENRINTIAVSPFSVFEIGDIGNELIDITQMFTQELEARGYELISPELLNDFMVQRRIRRPESWDRPMIRILGEVMGADVLVLGFKTLTVQRGVPKVTLSAQMVDCHEVSLLWTNTVSVTGDDYETILGLGRVKSSLELTRRALDKLLKDLPITFRVTQTFKPPFELVRASFSPGFSQSGHQVNIFVELIEITGKVAEVAAIFQGQEIQLSTRDQVLYSAPITAPGAEDSYSLELKIKDHYDQLYRMETTAVLTVHNTSPRLDIKLREEIISLLNKYILIIPEVHHKIGIKSWIIEIYNENQELIRIEEGLGQLPEIFIWDGKDNNWRHVPDGLYFCRLIVMDEAGNEGVSQDQKILVDCTPPEVEVFLAKKTDKGLILKIESYEMTSVVDWELEVYDELRLTNERFTGWGPLPETLEVQDLGDPDLELVYRYDIRAKDLAGNRLNQEYQLLEKLAEEPEAIQDTREIWIEDF